MSMMSSGEVICADCGKVIQIEIWETVNVTLDPDIKQRILDGSFYLVQCQACGWSKFLEYNSLYHDMERGAMIWLDPGGDPPYNLDSVYDKKIRKYQQGYRYRTVRTLKDLIEKIYIFDGLLDDRVLELYKLHMMENIRRARPEVTGWPFFSLHDHDHPVMFLAGSNTDDVTVYGYYGSFYEQIEKAYSVRISRLPLQQNEIIDQEWAEWFASQD